MIMMNIFILHINGRRLVAREGTLGVKVYFTFISTKVIIYEGNKVNIFFTFIRCTFYMEYPYLPIPSFIVSTIRIFFQIFRI